MCTSEQWAGMIYGGMLTGIKMLWDISEPILKPLVLSGIFASIIRKLVLNGAYNIFRVSGDSKRTAKKKSKKFVSVFDLTSKANDLSNNLK